LSRNGKGAAAAEGDGKTDDAEYDWPPIEEDAARLNGGELLFNKIGF